MMQHVSDIECLDKADFFLCNAVVDGTAFDTESFLRLNTWTLNKQIVHSLVGPYLYLHTQTCTYNMYVHAWVSICLSVSSLHVWVPALCLGKPDKCAWLCMRYASKHIQESSIINYSFDSADGIY